MDNTVCFDGLLCLQGMDNRNSVAQSLYHRAYQGKTRPLASSGSAPANATCACSKAQRCSLSNSASTSSGCLYFRPQTTHRGDCRYRYSDKRDRLSDVRLVTSRQCCSLVHGTLLRLAGLCYVSERMLMWRSSFLTAKLIFSTGGNGLLEQLELRR